MGESLDFWRVEEVEPERLLRLRAEMRLPGLAWLELGVRSDGDLTVYPGRCFHPHGLLGHVYWWVISPFHGVVFGGMKRNIAQAARTEQRNEDSPAAARGGCASGLVTLMAASARPR